MDFFQVINTRRSIRGFRSASIDAEALRCILEAASRAPSAGNLQAYEIYLVEQPEHREALVQAAADQDFLASAPLVLVFCANPARSEPRYGRRGRELYAVQDATIACTFAMLAAVASGLACVWVGAFDERAVRQVIQAPAGLLPVALLPVGYAGESGRITTRRPLDSLVHRVP